MSDKTGRMASDVSPQDEECVLLCVYATCLMPQETYLHESAFSDNFSDLRSNCGDLGFNSSTGGHIKKVSILLKKICNF